jgi:hypothetical protein
MARIGKPDRWWYEPAESPLDVAIPEVAESLEPAVSVVEMVPDDVPVTL